MDMLELTSSPKVDVEGPPLQGRGVFPVEGAEDGCMHHDMTQTP